MRVQSFHQRALLVIGLSLIFAVSFCYGTDETVEVTGFGECADCAQSNIKSSEAFSGLPVTIDCKTANGELKTRGAGELEEDGKFKVSLPQDIVENGKLKEECYAQLHSASSAVCPVHEGGLEASKIVLKSTNDGKQTFGTAGNLKFSPVTCTSVSLWHHFKYPPWKKKFKHPKFKKPMPEPEPEKPKPKPKPEPEKPKPKPKPEPEKPKPKPKPEPEKPKPKPKPKPEPEPEYKPKKKKHCRPFPKIPVYKFPPKYFPHPKLPPLPPHNSQP